MRRFFYPEGVAVFGVSETPGNLARVIIENFEKFEFKGKVFPIGPRRGTVAGREILTDVAAADGAADLAVLLVPASRIPETLETCGRSGIRHVVIESGGFSELDEGRKTIEDDIQRIASRWDMKIVGPNCFGVSNFDLGLFLGFFVLNPECMKRGRVSIISQSGGIIYDACALASCENVGLSKLASVGNKLLLNENDFLEYFIADPDTDIIGLYLEDFSNGRRFVNIAASTKKPIVVLKTNRSPAGNEIARFHTTALAGDDRVTDAALREAGVHRVQNLAEMIDAFKVFGLPPLKGRRLALITRSGGHGVLSADAAHRYGFELARFSDAFYDSVKKEKINVIRATNPLDVGDIYDIDAYAGVLDNAFQERAVDGAAYIVTFNSEHEVLKVQGFAHNAARLCRIHGKPVVLCIASNREQWLSVRNSVDFPFFTDVDYALRALAFSADHSECAPTRTDLVRRLNETEVGIGQSSARSGYSRFMDPEESFNLLVRYGIPVPSYGTAETAEEAQSVADTIGYPVALKIASPLVLHKTESGGVALNVMDRTSLREAMRDMTADRFFVQKMAPPALEVILGGKRDREFGHVLLFGLGGIFVEVFRDSSIRLLPVDERTVQRMIEEVQGSAILHGFRGKKPADIATLKEIMISVSRILTDHPEIKNLDINPLIVYNEGKGCVAVDAKIEIDEMEAGRHDPGDRDGQDTIGQTKRIS